MSIAAIEPFAHAVRTTEAWIRELSEELGWDDPHRATQALRGVLHALRDRLPAAEVVDLGAQLPMLIRGLYYEGWAGADTPAKAHREEFLDRVAAHFPRDPGLRVERVVRAVFRVLGRHVSGGEIDDIRQVLPADVRALWPEE